MTGHDTRRDQIAKALCSDPNHDPVLVHGLDADAVMPILDAAVAEARAETIDAGHIAHQRDWSTQTFGPGLRLGVIDHIRKELIEVEADPTELEEWVDVIILGFDGAWRAGHEPQQIIDAIKAKQARNEKRTWPDWRTADRDKAIEHARQHRKGKP